MTSPKTFLYDLKDTVDTHLHDHKMYQQSTPSLKCRLHLFIQINRRFSDQQTEDEQIDLGDRDMSVHSSSLQPPMEICHRKRSAPNLASNRKQFRSIILLNTIHKDTNKLFKKQQPGVSCVLRVEQTNSRNYSFRIFTNTSKHIGCLTGKLVCLISLRCEFNACKSAIAYNEYSKSNT